MQHVNNLLTEQTLSTPTTRAGQKTTTDSDFVNVLFNKLQAIFPGWRAAFNEPAMATEAKRQWLTGLMESGISTPEQINAGLKRARCEPTDFLPSVGKFISWCKDGQLSAMGVESETMAYTRLQAWLDKFSRNPAELTPMLWYVYQKIGYHDWMNMDAKEQRKKFVEQYRDAIELVRTGYCFELPPEKRNQGLIEAKPASKETALAALNAIKREF